MKESRKFCNLKNVQGKILTITLLQQMQLSSKAIRNVSDTSLSCESDLMEEGQKSV